MTFMNTFIEHDRTAEEEKWVKDEAAVQEALYAKIDQEINHDLAEKRAGWYEEFFHRITTKGFSEDGDLRRKIKPEDIPVKPNRPDVAVWKYGIDGE
jgi:hypothetical protein